MKDISVSLDVFQRIWVLRLPGERTEDDVLRRVLWAKDPPKEELQRKERSEESVGGKSPEVGKIRWVDDVSEALRQLGGEADLAAIYVVVRKIRQNSGRTVVQSIEATIRQTLEAHSSDSDNFQGRDDRFKKVGRGRWALR